MELTLQRWNSAPRAWEVRLTQSTGRATQLKSFKIFSVTFMCVSSCEYVHIPAGAQGGSRHQILLRSHRGLGAA